MLMLLPVLSLLSFSAPALLARFLDARELGREGGLLPDRDPRRWSPFMLAVPVDSSPLDSEDSAAVGRLGVAFLE